jgi:hypothetical protein
MRDRDRPADVGKPMRETPDLIAEAPAQEAGQDDREQ